jgi:hypothetical protein
MRVPPMMPITKHPKKLAKALANANGEAWDADHSTDPSDEAKERAKNATYYLAGLVMHNSNLIVDALRAYEI